MSVKTDDAIWVSEGDSGAARWSAADAVLAGSRERPFWRDARRRRLLAVADLATALCVAIVAAELFTSTASFVWSLATAPLWILLAKAHGLYDRDHRALRHLTVDELPALAVWSISGVASLALVLELSPEPSLRMLDALALMGTAFLGATFFRAAARKYFRNRVAPERALVVGDGELANALRRKLELFPDIHIRVVSHRPAITAADIRGDQALEGVDRVVLASSLVDDAVVRRLVDACRAKRVKLSIVPPVRGMFGTAVQLSHVADLPLVEYSTWHASRSTLIVKRALDIVVSAVGLVVLSPILLLITAAVALEGRGRVLFSQRRAGLNGKPFKLLKFRSMVVDAEEQLEGMLDFDALEEPVFKLSEDSRITPVGRLLRKTSLDELPQLVNVLRGEMTLVGPRPEQIELVERYKPEHRFRLSVKPGLTGPMQVYGRAHLSFDERLSVERDYIETMSIGRDLRLLALTFGVILGRRGAF